MISYQMLWWQPESCKQLLSLAENFSLCFHMQNWKKKLESGSALLAHLLLQWFLSHCCLIGPTSEWTSILSILLSTKCNAQNLTLKAVEVSLQNKPQWWQTNYISWSAWMKFSSYALTTIEVGSNLGPPGFHLQVSLQDQELQLLRLEDKCDRKAWNFSHCLCCSLCCILCKELLLILLSINFNQQSKLRVCMLGNVHS